MSCGVVRERRAGVFELSMDDDCFVGKEVDIGESGTGAAGRW